MALRNVIVGAIVVVAVVSIGLNVHFLYSRAVDDRTPVPEQGKAAGLRGTLERGMRLPVLEGRTPRGDRVTIDYGAHDRPTLLYVVTPGCVWCQRNEESFATIVTKRRDAYNFVVLSLSEAGWRRYHAKIRRAWGDTPVTALTAVAAGVKSRMFLGNTPQTIVISPQGVVVESWVGAYTRNRQLAIENFFRLRLPGLPPVPSSDD